jgi:hypothetical protein
MNGNYAAPFIWEPQPYPDEWPSSLKPGRAYPGSAAHHAGKSHHHGHFAHDFVEAGG